MLRRARVVIPSLAVWPAVVTLFLASPCPAQTSDRHVLAREPATAAALQVLDAWVAATVASREQPGLSIGVVHDQDLVWAKGYGFADLEHLTPATPATLYRIASISKLFTATSIMQLRDAGKLRLDDPVSDHLPWFSIPSPYDRVPAITVRHLITHTSGLPREAAGTSWSEETFPDRDAMQRGLPGQQAVFPPETQWKYSNLALSLAGEVVTRVSGEPWADYVQGHIVGPLDMTSTVVAPTAGTPGLATGYSPRMPGHARTVEPFLNINAVAPAGGMVSNVEDLAKFLSFQFRDDAGPAPVLRRSTVREMHRVQWLNDDWRAGWGLGFEIRRLGNAVLVAHGGGLPGQATYVGMDPERKLGVIVLTNAGDGDASRYVDRAIALLGPAVDEVAATPAPPPQADPAWQRYVGEYTSRFGPMNIMVLNGELTMVTPEAEDPWNSRIILRPAGPHTFRMESTGFSYEAIGETLTFELDATGAVSRVRGPAVFWLPKR